MTTTIREFLKMTKPSTSPADKLLDSIFVILFDGFKQHFQLSVENYVTIDDFFDDFSKQNPAHTFVKDWFLNTGVNCIKKINTEISIIDEIEAFLEFEKVTLEIDVYEGTRNDFLFAITETLPSIGDFITSFYEEDLYTVPLTHEEINLSLPSCPTDYTRSQFQINIAENTWSSAHSTTSSASKDAGLLLYA